MLVIYEVFRADLTCHVIVADDVVAAQAGFIAQPCCQLYERPVCIVVEFSGRVRVADFYGYSIWISVIARRRALIKRQTLDDLAVKADYVMRADV